LSNNNEKRYSNILPKISDLNRQKKERKKPVQKIRPPDKNNVSPKEKKERNNQAILGKSAYGQGFFLPTGHPKPLASGSGLPVRFTGNRSNLNLNSNAPSVRFVTGLPGGLER
jgi:hypothetical protein